MLRPNQIRYLGAPMQATQAVVPAPSVNNMMMPGENPIATQQTTAAPATIQQVSAVPPVPMGITTAPGAAMPVGVGAPPTGLIGAEQALNAGTVQARNDLTGAMNQVGTPNNYTLGGGNAAKMQADLSGANGPEAAAAASAQLQQSPAAKYQMEQMQRGVERSAAARGGLLGGNVLTELQRNAAGIASQDYQNQFANLGTVADRGANMQSQADAMKAGLSRDLASTAMSAGVTTAGLRMDAGRAIANNATQAASQISSLLNQQGIAVSDMMAKDISTLSDIIYQSGLQQTMNTSNLAAILANIAGGQASTVQQGNAAIGEANAAGTLGVGNAFQQGVSQGIKTGVIG